MVWVISRLVLYWGTGLIAGYSGTPLGPCVFFRLRRWLRFPLPLFPLQRFFTSCLAGCWLFRWSFHLANLFLRLSLPHQLFWTSLRYKVNSFRRRGTAMLGQGPCHGRQFRPELLLLPYQWPGQQLPCVCPCHLCVHRFLCHHGTLRPRIVWTCFRDPAYL